MSILLPKSIEDFIISCLKQGEKSSIKLLEEVRELRGRVTKQGFYAALRQLKAEEVITIRAKIVALNTAWIRRMQEIVENIATIYLHDEKSFSLLSLADKEHATFYFTTSASLDVFWGHSQNIFLHATSPAEPEYCYDPHYWFYIARKETEQRLLSEIISQGRQFLISVGGNDSLDQVIKSDFSTDYLQYTIDRVFKKENYYITIIGDYITEVFLDERIAEAVDHIYKVNQQLTEKVISVLEELLSRKARHRLKISRDAERALILKKRLGKNFYIKKGNSVK